MPVLEVRDLFVRFETHHGTVRAVDGVSFTLDAGETLGLVGESGSGKSVTNLALMGLVPSPPGTVASEGILLEGRNLQKLSERDLRSVRGNEVSMIFQDPMTSLNPFLTVGQQLVEVLEVHKKARGREARRRCVEGLADVGIPEPERRLEQYPHELSGGMRQRVMIAMALLCEPKVLLADEPTTALDVTIQAQILDLMKALQRRHGTAIVLVTHDLGVVAGMSDRVHVMYAGRLVETARTEALFARPRHPYTRGLLDSVPRLVGDPDAPLRSIPGQPPDLADLPAGCAFRPRCDVAVGRCADEEPVLEAVLERAARGRREAACFVADEDPDGGLAETALLEDGAPTLAVPLEETVEVDEPTSPRPGWVPLDRGTRGDPAPEPSAPEPHRGPELPVAHEAPSPHDPSEADDGTLPAPAPGREDRASDGRGDVAAGKAEPGASEAHDTDEDDDGEGETLGPEDLALAPENPAGATEAPERTRLASNEPEPEPEEDPS